MFQTICKILSNGGVMLFAMWFLATEVTANTSIADGVVIVSTTECCPTEAWPEAEAAIRAELELLDIRVWVVQSTGAETRPPYLELEEISRIHRAAAAVRITKPSSPIADAIIWVDDRVTGKTTFRKVSVDNASAPEAPTTIAVRTVDALRASLLEVRMQTDPEPANEPSAPIASLVAETSLADDNPVIGGVGVGVHGVLAGSTDDMGLRGGAGVTVNWNPVKSFGVLLEGSALPSGAEVKAQGATTTLWLVVLRGFIAWHFYRKKGIQPSLVVGGGSVIAGAEGGSTVAMQSSDTTAIGYVGGGARLQISISEKFGIAIGLNAGSVFPKLQIRHDDVTVATWGSLVIDGAMGIVVQLP